jgi:hypothetical protein
MIVLRRVPSVALAVAVVVGCGGEVAPSRAEQWCQAECDAANTCWDVSAPGYCESECLKFGKESALTRISDDYFGRYVGCLQQVVVRTCDYPGHSGHVDSPKWWCAKESRRDLVLRPLVSEYCRSMRRKTAECTDDKDFARASTYDGARLGGGPGCEDLLRVFTDANLRTAIACIARPCSDALACIVPLVSGP